MRLSTVSAWLDWIASLHTQEIDLGLERVKKIAKRLGVLTPNCTVIIVGGTNGKGTTVAALEAIYRAAGYRVGVFTSPVLFRHNEYVRINGVDASDEEFCQAYENIVDVLDDETLTPFEFHTLAALIIFASHQLDLIILEVGLGGRLDAVNIIDADLAIVTNVGIDHVAYLGETREKIGYEKAGIFRAGKFAVCGDPLPPKSLIEHAKKIGAKLFFVDTAELSSRVTVGSHLHPQNIAATLKAVILLYEKLPVKQRVVDEGLKNIKITGRIQVKEGDITEIFDVSHNPDAVEYLASTIAEMPCTGKTVAVFSMLADKDIASSIAAIENEIDEWYVAPLTVKRAASKEQLQAAFAKNKKGVFYFATIQEAYQAAKSKLVAGDRLIVFGSFHTVASCIDISR